MGLLRAEEWVLLLTTVTQAPGGRRLLAAGSAPAAPGADTPCSEQQGWQRAMVPGPARSAPSQGPQGGDRDSRLCGADCATWASWGLVSLWQRPLQRATRSQDCAVNVLQQS